MAAANLVKAFFMAAAALSLACCSLLESAPADGSAHNLIDHAIATAPAGEDGWNYYRSGTADLDGDGMAEKIVLATEVELVRGRPAWNDGHHWQVYVESPDGVRTQLYTQRLQLGTLTLRLTSGTGEPKILLVEHLPDGIKVYEIEYKGAGQTEQRVALHRQLDPSGNLASPSHP